MAVPSRIVLSGSTNGKPIPVAATATPGTTIHTSGSTGIDFVWLFVSNVTGSAATLTVEWGGASDPGDHLVKAYSVSANSLGIAIATGQPISGGLAIKAFSGTASALNFTGYVVRVI